MNIVYQSAFLKALGWSLLDSLWQMGVLWLVYVLLTANGKRFHARQRHSLALLSLAGGSIWFLITLVINFYKAAAAPEIITYSLLPGEALPASSPISTMGNWMEPVLPFLSSAYLVVTVFLFVRFYRQYRVTRRLSVHGLQKINPELRVYLQQAVMHLSLNKKVSIWLSSLVDTPLTIGFWKPVILLPIAAVSNLSMEQAEAIILHELYHIKRNDYLVNLLVAFTDILFFFNPFARLFSGAIRREREHSCDDIVLQFRYDAAQYAQALLSLEKSRSTRSPALAVAATGRSSTLLLNRVKRMLTNEPITTPVSQKLVAYLLSAFLIGFIGWYNPGRAIITTIREVAATPPANASNEYAVAIETAPEDSVASDDEQPAAMKTLTIQLLSPGETVAAEDDAEKPAMISTAVHESMAELQNKLITLVSAQGQYANEVIAYTNSAQMREYSMRATQAAIAAVGSIETHPFVPSNSFQCQALEDTLLPKNYVMTEAEKKARESLEKTLKALKEIDWLKLEKELNNNPGAQVDVNELQQEIRKALKEVDWKKINLEIESGLKEAQKELAQEQAAVKAEIERYNQLRRLQVEKNKQLQQHILLDRLGVTEKAVVEDVNVKPDSSTIKVRIVNGRKIVVI